MRAAVARVRLGAMTEPIPLWEDWRFWQIVVTGALAFLGFTFGTWVKYGFDLRRDKRRGDQERLFLAHATPARALPRKPRTNSGPVRARAVAASRLSRRL